MERCISDRMMFPRILWMIPGQTLFIGGVIRIDLLEVNNLEEFFTLKLYMIYFDIFLFLLEYKFRKSTIFYNCKYAPTFN